MLQAKVSHGARRTSTHERLLRPDAELQDHRRLSRESQRSAWPPQRPLCRPSHQRRPQPHGTPPDPVPQQCSPPNATPMDFARTHGCSIGLTATPPPTAAPPSNTQAQLPATPEPRLDCSFTSLPLRSASHATTPTRKEAKLAITDLAAPPTNHRLTPSRRSG